MKHLFATALLALVPAVAMAQASAPKSAAKSAAATAKKAAAAKPAAKPQAKATTAKTKANPDTKIVVAKAQPTMAPAHSVAAGVLAAGAVGGVAVADIAAGESAPQPVSLADQVHVGRMPCELGASVNITADPQSPGHFYVDGKGFKYHMVPVPTSTGTIRLEDQKAGAVWLQIANKSMLMDQKRGQRLADECMSPQQVVVAQAIKKNPPPSVLDALPHTAK